MQGIYIFAKFKRDTEEEELSGILTYRVSPVNKIKSALTLIIAEDNNIRKISMTFKYSPFILGS
jgi:hypothetical protein